MFELPHIMFKAPHIMINVHNIIKKIEHIMYISMYLHTILSGKLHIRKTTPHIMRKALI